MSYASRQRQAVRTLRELSAATGKPLPANWDGKTVNPKDLEQVRKLQGKLYRVRKAE